MKGDTTLLGQRVLRALGEVMRGARVGKLGASAGQSPLVLDFQRRLKELRLPLEHGRPQPQELAIFASDLALERSRFFHQCRFLEVGFAAWQRGPNLKTGEDLELTVEHWTVQYVPEIETKLTELSHLGATVHDVAAAALVKAILVAEGKSGPLAEHLLDALVMGLHRPMERLVPRLAASMFADDDVLSLVSAGNLLRTVLRGRERLEGSLVEGLPQLAQQAYLQGTLRLARLANMQPDALPKVLDALAGLLDVVLTDRTITPPRDLLIQHATLARDTARGKSPAVLGAMDGFLFQLGETDATSMAKNFAASRGRPDALGAYLEGVLAVARQALLGGSALLGPFLDHLRDADWECLHRVLVDAWARGLRTARGSAAAGASTSFARNTGASAPGAIAPRAPQGERLPPEDVLRFEPVLARCEALLAEMISFGLQRSTATTLERARTLSIVARTMGVRDGAPRHAGLGRLVRALDRTCQTLEEFQQRIVTTTELDVLRELGIIRNIVRAIRANAGTLSLADFAAATQQEYVALPALDAQGLGFEAWVTPAGYAGVTAYVADLRTGRVLTRTNALPADGNEGRSVGWAEALGSQAAFAGNSLSYLELARGRFLLSGAMIAPDSGRLSGSGKTQVAKRDPLPLDDPKLRAATLLGAGDALRIAERLGFDPLGRPPASAPVALVPVDAVRVSRFDRATQRLGLELTTKSGARLVSGIAYRDDRALYLDNLEKLARATPPPRLVFGRLKVDSEGFGFEPLTAYFDKGRPRHLTFRELDVETSALPRHVEDDATEVQP